MRVYNLTDRPIEYRGRTIQPSGGFVEFHDLTFIPDRDLKLQTDKVLAFGVLPTWFETKQRIRRVADLANEVTGEFLLTPVPLPGMGIPTLDPEDLVELPPAEDTLVPIPEGAGPTFVEKKIGRKTKKTK